MSRREFLGDVGQGLAGIALAQLLGAGTPSAAQNRTHHPAKAKRVLQIFCPGGCSHIDTFEHKPALEKWHGKPLPGEESFVSFQGKNGNLMKSPWTFVPSGESGKKISELLPHLGKLADDMAFIHSMTSKTNTHGPACVMMNTGFVVEGFPSAGAWTSYALGSENDNLPTYVTIPDVRGIPPAGPANWGAGFLPAEHQAIVFNAAEGIRNLERPASVSAEAEEATRKFLGLMNRRHAEAHPGNPELTARIASYELAARMQLSAPEAADLSQETAATHRLYGTEDPNPLQAAYARNCLLARRLIERDVRFVTLYCGSRASGVDGLLNWDAHKTLQADYERHCPILDRPTAGLIKDLRSRGLLDDTLVLWTTEFGRMPTHQDGTLGRDHNPDGFTVWMLGAGVKGGVSYGATDEFGRKAVENVSTIYDFYATVLHLLGLDHQQLTYYHNGIERRLTDVHGHVIQEIVDTPA
ncbi:MAG: DUF1501 domain-containing protein [Bryobacterales bacterium]|nr:DUF1501 domain-containing protein [Bryobacterales bacterium]MDE0294539.1 DUF1501 domain-containing protein [Bryobacterales bacterium]